MSDIEYLFDDRKKVEILISALLLKIEELTNRLEDAERYTEDSNDVKCWVAHDFIKHVGPDEFKAKVNSWDWKAATEEIKADLCEIADDMEI